MGPREMLDILSEYGGDAASDYRDGEEHNGWFGWTVTKDVLTVKFDHPEGTTYVGTWDLTGLSYKAIPDE